MMIRVALLALGAASAHAQTALPPGRGVVRAQDDLTYDAELSLGVLIDAGGILEGWNITAGSGCKIKYEELPWAVDCAVELELNTGINSINDGKPLAFEVFAGVVFDQETIDGAVDSTVEFRYGVTTPEIFGPEWLALFDVGTIDPISFPPIADEFKFDVPLTNLTEGLCLLEVLPELTLVFIDYDVYQVARAVDRVSDVTGVEVCLRVEDIEMDDGASPGASFRFVLALHVLDEEHMEGLSERAKAAVVDLRNTLLDRTTPIILEVDLGAAIRAQNKTLVASEDAYEGLVAKDGSFLLGARAETTESGPSTPAYVVPLAVTGGVLAVAAIGVAFVVKSRRSAVDESVVSHPGASNP